MTKKEKAKLSKPKVKSFTRKGNGEAYRGIYPGPEEDEEMKIIRIVPTTTPMNCPEKELRGTSVCGFQVCVVCHRKCKVRNER